MAQLEWGKAKQLRFANDHEYYQALGALCRDDSYTISFETNSDTDSWSDAYRIKCFESDVNTPDAFINAMRDARRINCNEYVENLYKNHKFDFISNSKVLVGKYATVIATVPTAFHKDFDDGYHLKITKYGVTPKSAAPKTVTKSAVSSHKPSASATSGVKKGDNVSHGKFGTGTVTFIKGGYVRILFPGQGEKQFPCPDAFDKGFLTKV